MKVYIVNGNGEYVALYRNAGHDLVENVEDADLVQFTGGEDVTPSLYSCKKHSTTHNSEIRDAREAVIYHECLQAKKPMVGICRGGQFLNVMNGGKMFQHVDGHALYGVHHAEDQITGNSVNVSSTHHQMMIPNLSEGRVILSCEPTICSYKQYVDGEGNIFTIEKDELAGEIDVECIYYAKTQSLCFQPHPEIRSGAECREYFFAVVDYLLFDDAEKMMNFA